MAQFSVNQTRQFYVGLKNTNKYTAAAGDDPAYYSKSVTYNSHDYSSIAKALASADASYVAKGDARIGKTADGKCIFIEQLGEGGVVRSDLMPIDSLTGAINKATDLSNVITHVDVALSGTAVSGADYVCNVIIRGAFTGGSASTYIKFGAYHATGTAASDVYAGIAKSLVANFSREENKWFKFYVYTASDKSTKVEVTSANQTLSSTYYGVRIEAVEQFWHLGTFAEEPVQFEVQGETIISGTEEVNPWRFNGASAPGVGIPVADSTPVYFQYYNAHKMADLEYFDMKARADVYGNMGWPNAIPATGMINPSASLGYHVISLHFAFQGANESIQKSEKELIIAVPVSTSATTYTEVNKFANAINDLAGKTILTPLS